VWSLHEEKLIESGNAVAIIGGGIGGITAALAAQHLGYTVTVFESADGVLDLQKKCVAAIFAPAHF
jgi:2-polyprenyl-6-methoxyphenol hydroxylase-like FAD-dependent oxidoreductase